MIVTLPGVVSMYVVEQLPYDNSEKDGLKNPVLLSVDHVMFPVGIMISELDTAAYIVTKEFE